MTDTHVCTMCPVPPGLPIIMGSHNVMTKGLFQARMGDPITCVGPPDMIAFGSPTVLTNMRPTARILDPTAKAGMITKGEPTVLIGMGGLFGMLMGMFRMAFVMSPPCIELAQRLWENQQAQNDLMLADAAYGDDSAPLPDGTRRATDDDFEALGLEREMTTIDGETFRADVFVETDPLTGNESYVVAFRGTQPNPWTGRRDWNANVNQGLGNENAYYTRAAQIGRNASAAQPGNVRFTGHSLGGGLASAAAGASGEPARTYNAAGLDPATAARTGGQTDQVEAYHLNQDPLTMAQQNTPLAESAGRQRGYDNPNLSSEQTPEPRAPRTNNRWIPDFLETPAKDARDALSDVGDSIANAWNDAGEFVDPLGNHGLEKLNAALEKEEEEIKEEQAENGCP